MNATTTDSANSAHPTALENRPIDARPKTISTLDELATASAGWDAEFSTRPLPADELRFEAYGLCFDGGMIKMGESGRTRIFNNLTAPTGYLKKLGPALQASVLTEHAIRGDFGNKPLLVMRNGAFETIVRGELQSLPIAAVIRSIQEAIGKECDSLFVARIGGFPERLDVELVSTSKEIAVRPGDIVQSGLHLSHHPFGTQATQIESLIYRLECTNGLTRRFCKGEGFERTRRLSVSAENGRELQMAQIRRLARRNWDGLQVQLEALRTISERPARVRDLLKQWLGNARITGKPMLERVVAAWQQEGGENTFFGAINALTRVATHHLDLSQRQRRTLAALAGMLAFSERHFCKHCFSILAGDAPEHSD
jgi:hypothetical protein